MDLVANIEKLIVAQSIKISLTHFESGRFIAIFTGSRQWTTS